MPTNDASQTMKPTDQASEVASFLKHTENWKGDDFHEGASRNFDSGIMRLIASVEVELNEKLSQKDARS